jgi:type IV secretion system protein VirB6
MALAIQLEQHIDRLLNNYVTTKSAAVAAMLTEPALIAFTIYIIMMGYLIIRGEANDPLPVFVWKVSKVMLIGGLALAGGQYVAVVVQFLTGIQQSLIQALAGAPTIGALLDDMARPFEILTNDLWVKGSASRFPELSLYWAAALVTIAEAWLFVIGIGMYLLSKIALALVLAVGPLFILCAMFPATQRFTESWVATALGFIFLAIFVAASVAMCTSFASDYADHITKKQDAINVLKASVSLSIASISLGIVILNVKTLASALSGGVSLQGVGSLLFHLMSRTPNRRPSTDPQPSLPNNAISQGSSGGFQRALPVGPVPLYQRNVMENLRRSH